MTANDSAARALGASETAPHGAAASAAATSVLPPFETVYEQYFDFVWSSARRLGVGDAAMDDVVQETFIVIHAKLHTVQQPHSLRSWIYGVVRRTVSDHHRSRRTRESSGVSLALQHELEHAIPRTPHDLSEQNEQVRLLWALLDELDAAKRETFILVELEELSVPEVAEALDIPLNTAYSRLRAARLAFEAALARRMRAKRGGES